MSVVRVAKQELRPFLTPKTLAEYLAISERTVRDMLSKQRIPSYKSKGSDESTPPTSRSTLPVTATARHDPASDRPQRRIMANRRERPISRVNPSGERVWRARATDPAGRRRYLGAFKLKRQAQDAIDDRCATANPFKGVRMRAGDPRVSKLPRATHIWTLDEMHEFAAAAGSRNEPMLRMLSDCGLRVGEMLALRRGLQDLKIGIFRVKGTAWNGSLIETSREKNHDREGPIPPGTLALLRAMPPRIDVEWLFPTPGSAHTRRPRIDWPAHEELLAELETMSYKALSRKLGVSDNALRNRLRAYAAGRQPGDGRGNDGGKLWRYDNWMRDVWNPTVKRTGMSATPKEFRASWETHLIAAGANTDDVAAIAGHSINVQAEHYRQALHRSSEFIKAAIG
jgi:excisionase family DNA binding protein